jgi:hypothetical protein
MSEMIAGGADNSGAERSDQGNQTGSQPNQAELDEARAIAEDARRREAAELERQRQQERSRD